MRKILLLALVWLLPSLASAQLVGGNANLLPVADETTVGNATTWSVSGGTVTLAYAAGPGTSGMQATRLQLAQYQYLGHFQVTGLTPNATVTFSIYATATSSGSTTGAAFYTDCTAYESYHWTTPTFGTWARISCTGTVNSSGNFSFSSRAIAQDANVTADVLLWGAKLEYGSSATGAYPAATPDTYFWGGRWGFLRGASSSVSAPTIASFIASPATIVSGGTSTLTWSYGGGTPTSASIDNGVGSVLGLSSKSVSPASTTTYTLDASNAGGSTAASATVTVTGSGISTGSWVSAAGTACTNGSALVPDAAACEWQPCKDDPMPAVVYYVCSVGGDDTRTATQARDPSTPWATIAKANTQFSSLNAGEALAFCRGGTFALPDSGFSPAGPNWSNANGTQANPVVVRDYTRPGRAGMGDPRPIFTGENFSSNLKPGRIKIENIAMHASAGTQAMVFGYDGVTDVTACNLEIAGASIAVQYQYSDAVTVLGMVRDNMIGCRALNATDQGFLGQSQYGQITDNYFYNIPTSNTTFNHPIYLDGHSNGSEANSTTGELIARNEIHPVNGYTGVALVVGGIHKSMTIEGNKIVFDLGQPAQGGWGIQAGGTGYSDLIEMQDIAIRGNTVINPGGQGIGVATCKSNCLIENNLIIGTQQAGVGIAAPNQSNPWGVPDLNYTVRNNTVYMTVAGSTGIKTGAYGSGDVVANNAVQAPTCYAWEGASGAYIERDYNACYVGSDTPVGTHSFTANPLWVNPTSSSGFNFKPGTGSPLISAGDSTQNPGIDLIGATRPTAPSIGAYEP